jgi:SAM-dependent methyltransferase
MARILRACPFSPTAAEQRTPSSPPVCLACRSENLRQVRHYRSDSPAGRELFGSGGIYRCEDCSLAQLHPIPAESELAQYYESDYRGTGKYGADVADTVAFPRDNLFYYNRGESVASLLDEQVRACCGEAPSIIDVGAGYGHILHALGARFPRATRVALELSDTCVRHLASIGVEVIPALLEQFAPRGRKFDVVILSHVLEHFRAPASAMRALRDLLTPRGVLYIEVPNIPVGSLTKHPDSKWAPRYDEPHITFFSVDSLRHLIQANDLEVTWIDTAGPRYHDVSALRYRLPPLKPLIARSIPSPIFQALRSMRATQAVRVKDREDEFFQYGGYRIWIRSLSRPLTSL